MIERFFSKIFNRLFPELQEGDIVRYRGRKQRVIGSWHETYLDHDYSIKRVQVILLSYHGQLSVTTDSRLLIRKLGHEPVLTFNVGDQVRLKELEIAEWRWIEQGFGTLLTSEQILDLLKQAGTVVRINLYHLISNNYSKPTIHVRFDDTGYEIALYPCFLDKIPDYDIV